MFHHDYNNSQSSNQHSELNEEDSFDLKLIESVKTNPVLYVKRNKKTNSLKITQAWDSISESTNKTVEECQTRFKRLREYYSRERQRQKQGLTEIKFKFYNEMNFLAPYTFSRKILQNKEKPSKENTKNNVQEVDKSMIELEFPELEMTNVEQIDCEENDDLFNARSTTNASCSVPQINDMEMCNFQDDAIFDRPLRNITNSITLNDNIRATTITPSVAAVNVNNNFNNNPDPLLVQKSSAELRKANPTSDLLQKKNAAENEMLKKKLKSDAESKDLCQLIATRLRSIKENEKKNNFIKKIMMDIFD